MNATKEMEKSVKRSRAPNWDSTEKSLLKEILKEYTSIIECKRTDTNTNKSKIAAWNTVYKRFTELNQRERCLTELKQQWRCMKLEAKRIVSEHRQAVFKTGGGPKPPSPSKEVTDVVEMVPLEFQEDTNEFDSNGPIPEFHVVVEYEEDPSNILQLPRDDEKLEGVCEARSDAVNSDNTTATSSPGKERPPPEDREGSRKKRQLPKESEDYKLSIKKIAEKRSSTLLKLQEEEHETKMQSLQQDMDLRMKEHQARMRNLEEERQQKEKEHAIKMEILLFKKNSLLKNL